MSIGTVFRGTVPVADAAPGFNQDVNVRASLYNPSPLQLFSYSVVHS